VRADSDLAELWGHDPEWLAEVDSLDRRLAAAQTRA
jgi:hypothetical protein